MSEMPGTPSPEWSEMADKVKAAKGPDRMILIAAAILLVSSFLPWFGVTVFGVSVNGNAWDESSVMIGVLLGVAAGVISLMVVLGKPLKTPPTLQLGLGIGSIVLIGLKALGNLEYIQFGAILGIVSAVAITVSAFKLQAAKD